MKKIVHVTQYFHPNKGYQENNLAKEQIKLGYDVTIICSDDLSLWSETTIEKNSILSQDKVFNLETGIQIKRIRKLFKISGRVFSTGLGRRIINEKPDIIFLHGAYLPYTLLGLLSVRNSKKKDVSVIIDDHMVLAGSFNRNSKTLYKLFKPLFNTILNYSRVNIKKWVAVSEETRKFMEENYGIKDTIELIPLGFNSETCYYDKLGAEKWKKDNNLSDNYKYVLYIGKCDNYKNPKDLLVPFKKFIKNNSNFALIIVGEITDQYKFEMLADIEKLNLTGRVFFFPPVHNNEIKNVLSLAFMAIWPNGSSMTMLEAMACECPVIAKNIDVNIERLSEMRGLLFNDFDELHDKMNIVLTQREIIINNAKEWINRFTWTNINEKFLN